ncbi:MAG TPA: methyltransferase domain-containing protein [Abditibacteriaceae bacterium]|jgi:SAM-dependent methyltransferase
MHTHLAEWDLATIDRFWDHMSQKPEPGSYFSYFCREGLTKFLDHTGHFKGCVLDYGCGPGYLLEYMAQIRPENTYTGVDFSLNSITKANSKLQGQSNWRGAHHIQSLPTSFDREFDVVTCIEVIEHLSDDYLTATLAEIRRVLRPEGTCLFTTPFNENLEDNRVFCPFCATSFHGMQHLRTWNIQTLTEVLKKNGFDVIYCNHLNFEQFQASYRYWDSWKDVSPRSLIRWILDKKAILLDKVSPRQFPEGREFRRLAVEQQHLCAVVSPTP